jgi:hypothetical protein
MENNDWPKNEGRRPLVMGKRKSGVLLISSEARRLIGDGKHGKKLDPVLGILGDVRICRVTAALHIHISTLAVRMVLHIRFAPLCESSYARWSPHNLK